MENLRQFDNWKTNFQRFGAFKPMTTHQHQLSAFDGFASYLKRSFGVACNRFISEFAVHQIKISLFENPGPIMVRRCLFERIAMSCNVDMAPITSLRSHSNMGDILRFFHYG